MRSVNERLKQTGMMLGSRSGSGGGDGGGRVSVLFGDMSADLSKVYARQALRRRLEDMVV
jgi:hypothetical protein